MDRIAALQFFIRVVDSGSFSQAARNLGVGQPAVSKQISALERRLAVQLLIRTSRGLRPTPAGMELYRSASRLLGDLDDMESRVSNGHRRPSGAVHVAAPPTLTSMMLVPRLPEFYADYPEVTVEFAVSERYVDLMQEGLDLAIRVGTMDSSGLVSRKIGDMKMATVASPAYLARHGVPREPSELASHRLVRSRNRGAVLDWQFAHGAGRADIPAVGEFSSNDPADIHAAALAGLGIAQSARGLFDRELQSGQLVEVLSEFAPPPVPVHLVYATARSPHRVRVFADFLIKTISAISSLRAD